MPQITTVTLNPALDEAVELDRLELGGKSRCSLDSLDPGGKGVNASRVIARLGRRTLAMMFSGGCTGDLLEEKLREEAVPFVAVRVDDATRVNIMIYESATGRRSRLYLPGARIRTAHLRELEGRLEAVPDRGVVVLGGSVPPGAPPWIYRDLILRLKERGVRCVVDTSGDALSYALEAHPALVKPNVEEASQLLGIALDDDDAVFDAALTMYERGAEQVVISQGSLGAIGVNAIGAWKAVPPEIRSRSTVGSGDSMVAGLAIALDENQSLVEGLRLGSAAGAATALIAATRLCRREDVVSLLPQVVIRDLRAPGRAHARKEKVVC